MNIKFVWIHDFLLQKTQNIKRWGRQLSKIYQNNVKVSNYMLLVGPSTMDKTKNKIAN